VLPPIKIGLLSHPSHDGKLRRAAPHRRLFQTIGIPVRARSAVRIVVIEPFLAAPALIRRGADMTQADHYRDQSIRAKRLARAVRDPETSKKLIEMAEEFRLYAERLDKIL